MVPPAFTITNELLADPDPPKVPPFTVTAVPMLVPLSIRTPELNSVAPV